MASRPSVRHPSHNHPLRSHKTRTEDEIICSGCDLDLTGASFKCTKSECDYILHKSCFDLPKQKSHKSHQDHPLILLYSPPYQSTYTCDACGEYGSGFTYNCSICQYDVHIGCVSMLESVKREDHVHPLALLYRTPYENGLIFECDICHETVPDNLWSYYCEECDYGTHLHCSEVVEEEEVRPKQSGAKGGAGGVGGGGRSSSSANSELAAMLEAQREMEKMQIELHLEMQRAKIAKKARKACLKLI